MIEGFWTRPGNSGLSNHNVSCARRNLPLSISTPLKLSRIELQWMHPRTPSSKKLNLME